VEDIRPEFTQNVMEALGADRQRVEVIARYDTRDSTRGAGRGSQGLYAGAVVMKECGMPLARIQVLESSKQHLLGAPEDGSSGKVDDGPSMVI